MASRLPKIHNLSTNTDTYCNINTTSAAEVFARWRIELYDCLDSYL